MKQNLKPVIEFSENNIIGKFAGDVLTQELVNLLVYIDNTNYSSPSKRGYDKTYIDFIDDNNNIVHSLRIDLGDGPHLNSSDFKKLTEVVANYEAE